MSSEPSTDERWTSERWTSIDRQVGELLGLDDPALSAALDAAETAGLPRIQVSAPQGKLLHLLALAAGARRILEIGTLAGYSGIWLARALPPDGRLVTLEVDPRHAEVARASFARAGLSGLVDVRLGPALETLPLVAAEGLGPFDLIFIDADKAAYPDYLSWSLRLSRRGTTIVADNVVRRLALADTASDDPDVRGIRRFVERLGREDGLSATVIQTVGSKGYDGLAVAVVTGQA